MTNVRLREAAKCLAAAIQVFLLPLKAGLPRRIKRSSQRRASLLAICLLCSFLTPAYAGAPPDPYPFTSTADSTRFTTLTNEIRCVVCQHQSIAESNSPLADGMRHKVYQMILDKKSDHEIKDYLVKRYGEFILLNPRVNARTVLLWVFPFLALVLGGGFLIRLFRQ